MRILSSRRPSEISSSWPLWTAVLAGGLLRLVGIDRTALFLDEAWSWAFAGHSITAFLQMAIADLHPPLYYLLLKGWLAFVPATELTLRLPSAVFSTISLGLLTWFARRHWGARTALFAAILGALSTFDLHYAQDARMYSLLALIWLASFVCMVEATLGARRALPVWAALAALLPWTHLYGAIAATLQAITLAFSRFRGRSSGKIWPRDRWWIVLVIASIAIVAILFRQHRDVDAGGAWTPSVRDLGGLLALILAGLASARPHFLDPENLVPDWLAAVPLPLWGAIALLLALPAAHGLHKSWRNPDHRLIAIASFICVLCPVIAIWTYAELFDLKAWAYKPLLATAYFVYLWLAAGLAAMRTPLIQAIALAAIVAVNLASIVPFYTEWRRWPLAQPLRSLADEIRPGESVLVEDATMSSMIFFYLPDCDLVWTLREPADEPSAIPSSTAAPIDRLALFPVPLSESIRGQIQPTTCADPRLRAVLALRYFGDPTWLRSTHAHWPPCLSNLPLQVYRPESGWQPWRYGRSERDRDPGTVEGTSAPRG